MFAERHLPGQHHELFLLNVTLGNGASVGGPVSNHAMLTIMWLLVNVAGG